MNVKYYEDFFHYNSFFQVEKLRCLGHIGIAEGDPALIAYRRWKKWGLIRVGIHFKYI